MAESDELDGLNYRELQSEARRLSLPARRPENVLRKDIREARKRVVRPLDAQDPTHVATQPIRRRILSLVAQGIATNSLLADRMDTKQQNINFHARALVAAGLLHERAPQGGGRGQAPKEYVLSPEGRALLDGGPPAHDRTEVGEVSYTIRADAKIVDTLRQAGLSPEGIAKEALQREAKKIERLAALRRLEKEAKGFRLGFDATEFIRRDRDSHA